MQISGTHLINFYYMHKLTYFVVAIYTLFTQYQLTNTHVYTYENTDMHACTYVFLSMCIYVYMHTQAYIYIYIYTYNIMLLSYIRTIYACMRTLDHECYICYIAM